MTVLLSKSSSSSKTSPSKQSQRGQGQQKKGSTTTTTTPTEFRSEVVDSGSIASEGSGSTKLLSSGDHGGSEWKLVLVVRTDLEMGKGKVAAQCCHATLAAYTKMMERDPKGLKRWENWGQAKITLKCPSEEEMMDLQKKAREKGLVAQAVRDAGRTQIAAGSRTVLAIGPGPKKVIDVVTGHLKLY
ncbi:Peptidyl-tRNA hydrolase protein 2, mitochondrial [Blyttiomyces sp. JEL0837]|nr:Peptidyl-tRNA hydrolase protein 2, mitochondrial [Blyttiomyces sp. JEL0837]